MKRVALFICMLALVVVYWTTYARVTRGVTLSLRQEDYMLAARSIGHKKGRESDLPALVVSGLAFVAHFGVRDHPMTPKAGVPVTLRKCGVFS